MYSVHDFVSRDDRFAGVSQDKNFRGILLIERSARDYVNNVSTSTNVYQYDILMFIWATNLLVVH